jgi:SAM-dependent methyltransferase
VILEAGCGSGRFTEIATSTGATVLSIDSSMAVDANYRINGTKANLLLVQADLFEMPFPDGVADRLFCLGVLQHTPDPAEAFVKLVKYVKPGGHLAFDVYRKIPVIRSILFTKYLARRMVRNISTKRLYNFCEQYAHTMWPITGVLNRINPALSALLLLPDPRGVFDLRENLSYEWAVLGMFDMLSPVYDNPQSVADVAKWFKATQLVNENIQYDWGMVCARGVRPIS